MKWLKPTSYTLKRQDKPSCLFLCKKYLTGETPKCESELHGTRQTVHTTARETPTKHKRQENRTAESTPKSAEKQKDTVVLWLFFRNALIVRYLFAHFFTQVYFTVFAHKIHFVILKHEGGSFS